MKSDEKAKGKKSVRRETMSQLREKIAALTVKNELLMCEIRRKDAEIEHWRAMALEENGAADELAKMAGCVCKSCRYLPNKKEA